MDKKRVIVIGGGASGLMAAGRAAEAGADVMLLEKTAKPGSKLLLTGQGRCNLSHTGDAGEFVPRYNDGRFLYSAFSRFFRDDLLDLLDRYGLKPKTEADGRVFPATEDARDVVAALVKYASDNGAAVQNKTIAEGIIIENGSAAGVLADKGPLYADAIILAAGGSSYPATGSSGDGCRMAESAGHTIVPLRPALVPLRVAQIDLVKEMQGASLSGVCLTAFRSRAANVTPAMMPTRDYGRGIAGKKAPPAIIESRTGDVLFAHFGLSGPAVLSISLAVVDALAGGPVSAALDMRPEIDAGELRRELQESFDSAGKRIFRNIMETLVQPKMADALVRLSGISPEKQGHDITAGERETVVGLLKCLRFDITGPLSLASATVTAGGVSLKEIDPRTMGSRLVSGLYFCGEVIDIDGDSGGYNLQAAFSTGWVAAESAVV